MKSISLFIHIPFCAKKCRYCDFYSVAYEKSPADVYIDVLSKEIALLRKNGVIADKPAVQTVYFGGGTPSVLLPDQLKTLFGLVLKNFTLASGVEWTVECNPESFSGDKAGVLLDSGVTRLSFGFQSLDDCELAFLGRIHNSARCRKILTDPVLSQFSSVGIDLIYGLPGQTADSIEKTIGPVLDCPHVKHISAYELTLAEHTPLGRHRSLLPLPGDEAMCLFTRRLWELLEKNGYAQYEVSNFAKPGHASRHNQAYWNHEPYVGLGCAAHSWLQPQRSANVKDVNRYCAMIESGELPQEFIETIDGKKLAMEMLFLGLRRTAGINTETFRKQCGIPFNDFVNKDKLSLFISEHLITYEKSWLKSSKKGLLMADAMARELKK